MSVDAGVGLGDKAPHPPLALPPATLQNCNDCSADHRVCTNCMENFVAKGRACVPCNQVRAAAPGVGVGGRPDALPPARSSTCVPSTRACRAPFPETSWHSLVFLFFVFCRAAPGALPAAAGADGPLATSSRPPAPPTASVWHAVPASFVSASSARRWGRVGQGRPVIEGWCRVDAWEWPHGHMQLTGGCCLPVSDAAGLHSRMPENRHHLLAREAVLPPASPPPNPHPTLLCPLPPRPTRATCVSKRSAR